MPRRLSVRRPYPQLTVSPDACRRNGWRVELACVRCLWFFQPRFGPQHARYLDRDFEALWTRPGFKCARCGRWPKTLRVWRPRARPVLILQLEGPKEHHGSLALTLPRLRRGPLPLPKGERGFGALPLPAWGGLPLLPLPAWEREGARVASATWER